MTKEAQYKNFLRENGFTYNCVYDAYTKEVRINTMTLGVILVRFIGGTFINPIFRSNGQYYFSMVTLDDISNLLDKYDRALTDIELR